MRSVSQRLGKAAHSAPLGPPSILYQPIVSLDEGRDTVVVGFEALARWPDRSTESVFADAGSAASVAELDWQCRVAALRGALDADLGRGPALFVNVEPASLVVPPPADEAPLIARAAAELDIVLELTERRIADDPASLLATVAQARAGGWRVALDDVGANPDSLALMEFIRPDVVKLELRAIHKLPEHDRARVSMAVLAYCERSGAALLGEGIETEEHLDQALALGVTLGQGWLFGHPDQLATDSARGRFTWRSRPAAPTPGSPFEYVSQRARPRVARKPLLRGLTRDIELQAANQIDPPVVLASFESPDRIGPTVLRNYSELASRSPLVVALGADMPGTPAVGVRGAPLYEGDPLLGEWTLVVVGSHYAAALIARDLGDDGPEEDRRFEYVVTHDRDTVSAAGRSLLARLTG